MLLYASSMVPIESFTQNLDYVWAKKSGGTYTESGNGVATDAVGNVVVTGTFFSSSITFDNITLTKSDSLSASMFVAKYSPDGNILWAKRASTPSPYMETYGYSVVTDADGNVYVSGDLVGDSITFDNQTIVLPEPYNQASFLVKYNAAGLFVWAKMALNGRAATSVAMDDSGNLFVSGIFSNQIDFDGILIHSVGSCYGIFLAKYGSSGNLMWANATNYSFAGNGTPDAMSNALCTDNNGNIYLTGFFGSDTMFFDASHAVYVVNNESVRNVFLAKYDNNGNALWATGAVSKPSLFRLSGNGVKAIGDHVYLVGEFEGDSVQFGNNIISKTDAFSEIFITKYDKWGNNIWANSLGTESIDYGHAVITDNAGNVCLAATTNGEFFQINSVSVDTLPGGNNAALVKFDENGNFLQLITPVNGPSGQSSAKGMAIDGNDNIFLTGGFSNTVYFGLNPLTSTNFWDDVFVCKLNSSTIGFDQIMPKVCNLRVFPNPAADWIEIELTRCHDKALDLKIFDLKGVLVKTMELNQKNTKTNISELNNGVYILVVDTSDGTERHPLIIHR